jgi:NitT/TauT family transport system permease protein
LPDLSILLYFAALIAAWQAWVVIGDVWSIVIPAPAIVLGDIAGHPGDYAPSLAATVAAAASGAILGFGLGIGVAILGWLSPVLGGLLTPVALVIRTVPLLALVPVFARLVGYGDGAVLAVAGFIGFFPAFVWCVTGLRATPPGADDLLTVLGASRLTRLRRLALPAALPNMLVALRLVARSSIEAAVVAEFLVGTRGLGFLLERSRGLFMPERAWGVALLITALAVGAYLAASRVERHSLERWT